MLVIRLCSSSAILSIILVNREWLFPEVRRRLGKVILPKNIDFRVWIAPTHSVGQRLNPGVLPRFYSYCQYCHEKCIRSIWDIPLRVRKPESHTIFISGTKDICLGRESVWAGSSSLCRRLMRTSCFRVSCIRICRCSVSFFLHCDSCCSDMSTSSSSSLVSLLSQPISWYSGNVWSVSWLSGVLEQGYIIGSS